MRMWNHYIILPSSLSFFSCCFLCVNFRPQAQRDMHILILTCHVLWMALLLLLLFRHFFIKSPKTGKLREKKLEEMFTTWAQHQKVPAQICLFPRRKKELRCWNVKSRNSNMFQALLILPFSLSFLSYDKLQSYCRSLTYFFPLTIP